MKGAKRIVSWIVRLAILGALAYFLRPLYAPPKPTLPSKREASDFVSWTMQNDPNTSVVQRLVIYGDGRNEILITRTIADPSIPAMSTNWTVKRNRTNGLSEFRWVNVLPAQKAKATLNSALEAGVLNLESIPAAALERLEMQTSFDGRQRTTTGPQWVGSVIDWNPDVWINRIRWQKVGSVIGNDPVVDDLLAKKKIILTDDEGKEIGSVPETGAK